MLKILWKRGNIAPEEQFLPLSTIFYYLMLDFYVKTGIRFSLRDKRLFEITEVEITRVDCMLTVWFLLNTHSAEAIIKSDDQLCQKRINYMPTGSQCHNILLILHILLVKLRL